MWVITGFIFCVFHSQVMFSLFLVYLLVVMVSRLRSQSTAEFLSQVWNWVDLLVLVTACTQSALYVACVVTATEQVNHFLLDRSVPSQLGITILLHGLLRWMQGLLVFLLCFKVFIFYLFIYILRECCKWISCFFHDKSKTPDQAKDGVVV